MAQRCLWMAPYVKEKLSVKETDFLDTLTFDTLPFGHIDFWLFDLKHIDISTLLFHQIEP